MKVNIIDNDIFSNFVTNRSETEIKSVLKRLKKNFPKFKENRYFYYFDDYEERYGKYEVRAGTDKDKDKDKEKDKERFGFQPPKEEIKKLISDLSTKSDDRED